MAKVWCAENECLFNKDNECLADYINITAGRIHSRNQGYCRHWECRTFKQSAEVKELYEMLKSYFDNMEDT